MVGLQCAAPAAGQVPCDDWENFWRATAEQATHCLDSGADTHALWIDSVSSGGFAGLYAALDLAEAEAIDRYGKTPMDYAADRGWLRG